MAVGTSHNTWIWLSRVEKIFLRLWNYCACHAKARVTFAPERGSHSPLNPLHPTSFRGKCDPTWFRGKCDPRANWGTPWSLRRRWGGCSRLRGVTTLRRCDAATPLGSPRVFATSRRCDAATSLGSPRVFASSQRCNAATLPRRWGAARVFAVSWRCDAATPLGGCSRLRVFAVSWRCDAATPLGGCSRLRGVATLRRCDAAGGCSHLRVFASSEWNLGTRPARSMITSVNLLLNHGFYLFQGEGLIWINHQELDLKRLNVHHCANRQITSRFTASRYSWWIHNIQWPFFEFLKKIIDSASPELDGQRQVQQLGTHCEL